jgi:nanoRNase/pAp phosphatase (c-di-AMP/oligoRNAs hydrolase)/CBS domain-containing protein
MEIITTHKNTDFDAMASVVAATLLYPDAIAVLPKTLNPNVRGFLSIHKDIFDIYSYDEIKTETVERLIVVDACRWRRLNRIANLRDNPEMEVIVWDHHTEETDMNPTWQCRENTGATVTLLLRQIFDEGKEITPIQATLFLIGIYEDTGHLTFPATRPEDVRAAAALLERGADLNILGAILRPSYGEQQKDLLFRMIKTGESIRVEGLTVSVNRQTIEGHVEGLAVVVRMYRELLNVDAAFGIFSARKRCIVIGRSNVPDIDIGVIMRTLGGGGHPGAGSALLKSVNPEVVEEMILDLVRGNRQSSVQISDLMSYPVSTVAVDTAMVDVAQQLRSKGCTGMPVVDSGKLVGVISRRDFRKLRKESQLSAPVKAYMSRNVVSISPGKSPVEAVRLMVKHDIGRLPVVQDGRIIGIVTRSDAMLYFYDLLPD